MGGDKVQSNAAAPGKKKGASKGSKGARDEADEIGDDGVVVVLGGKKKGKGKKGSRQAFDDDDYFIDPEAGSENSKATVEEKQVPVDEILVDNEVGMDRAREQLNGEETKKDVTEEVAFTGKKKAKGKGKKTASFKQLQDFDEDFALDEEVGRVGVVEELPGVEEAEILPEVEDEVVFSGKKKSKGKKSLVQVPDSEFLVDTSVYAHGLEDEAAVLSDAEEPILFTGKKKAKKGKKEKVVVNDDEYDVPADSDAVLDSEAPEEPAVSMVADSKAVSPPEVGEDDIPQFGGKKKSKKGKKAVKGQADEDIDAILAELEAPKVQAPKATVDPVVHSEAEPPQVSSSSASSKKKQKKAAKKSGRTAQEEEDLDDILAELGGPIVVRTPEALAPVPEATSAQDAKQESVDVPASAPVESSTEVEEVVESAAAKKKKKKKEKEKAKAAGTDKQAEAAEETKVVKEESKAKVPDKKLPKHVREMQERLARMKELEEKRRQEEEEKRRREEEEQARLEELERQKEEAKRRRKEREKEKLLQKKKEGKLLNEKQKQEQRRLAAMREQFIAQTGGALGDDLATEEVKARPKPKYETKKKKRPTAAQTDSSLDVDTPAVPEVQEVGVDATLDLQQVPEKVVEPEEPVKEEEQQEEEEQEEEEEEEDWDAKSWEQEVALPVIKSAFAEEEEDDASSTTSGKLSRALSRQDSSRSSVSRQDSVSSVPSKPPAGPPKALPAKVKPGLQQQKESDNEGETDSEDETESEEEDADLKRRQDAKAKREARKAEALTKRSAEDLRSPICCILGHVDTGKTKLLDCIRRTNVQEGEAGGITQQIGATYFPMENIRERTKEIQSQAKLRVPGLLVIDTPGHESFTNLRARGSSLCDIAILVIDIMHGLEPQTIESLNLLKSRKTPFVVALNKVDRLYGWKPCPNKPIKDAFNQQSQDVKKEFEDRLTHIVTQLKEQGLNSELYYRNKEIRKFISIVPTSAISGEGVPDILMLLIQLTQKMMEDKLMYISEVQCTVLEVKVVEGLGTTIDVILVNGVLHEGDQIVVCGMQEPIVTTIRALLTPHPMKELRVKGSYQHHKELKAAQGIKLTAQGLEHAIAGTQLYVVGPEDDLEDVKEEAMQDMKNVMSRIDKSGEGVCVQASTLGSLEALLEFLKSPSVKIPVSGIGIGPVHKKDVMRASVMLERKRKEYATILAFDVKVTPEAKELAEEYGVKIFMADIIYHLFDQFTAYMNSVKEEKRKESAEEAVFPCILEILPQCVFNKKDPIVVGVNVVEGIAKVGTPLCVPSKEYIAIGKIASIEVNHKDVDTAKKGQSVAMKIVGTNAEETQKMVGRHFFVEDNLVSTLTRNSIDLLKENYRDDLSNEDWRLVVKLKKLFEIP